MKALAHFYRLGDRHLGRVDACNPELEYSKEWVPGPSHGLLIHCPQSVSM